MKQIIAQSVTICFDVSQVIIYGAYSLTSKIVSLKLCYCIGLTSRNIEQTLYLA